MPAGACHAADMRAKDAEIEGFRSELGAMIATMTRLTTGEPGALQT